MPVITFANTKGGAGKTTAAALVALELARRGHGVTVIDSDPQHWLSQWLESARPAGNIDIVSHVTPASLECLVAGMRPDDYFIIDLAGDRNQITAAALAYSNHVLIPVQGAGMDGKGAAKILDILNELNRQTGYAIPHSILLSRVNPLVTTHSLLTVKGMLAQRGVNVLPVPLIERAAYREMFEAGVGLRDLDAKKISNLDKAFANAESLCDAVLKALPARIVSARRRPGWSRAA
jgi:chromosome partitioning protein